MHYTATLIYCLAFSVKCHLWHITVSLPYTSLPCFSVLYTSPIFSYCVMLKNTGTPESIFINVACNFLMVFLVASSIILYPFPVSRSFILSGASPPPDTYNSSTTAYCCQPQTQKIVKNRTFFYFIDHHKVSFFVTFWWIFSPLPDPVSTASPLNTNTACHKYDTN